MIDATILSVKNLSKYYQGITALNNVSIDFQQGKIHALVGENGAGKSTFIKSIAGAITPDAGTIAIEGSAYTALTPALSRRHGIEVIYQEFNLVPDLSVAENIYLGGRVSKKKLVDYKGMFKSARKLFSDFGIEIDPGLSVSKLSPALQQIVEICKAISKDVKLLIMDEPTAPLTITEVDLMFAIVERLKKNGVTIIYISHRLEEVFRITDRVTVLRDGNVIQTLETKDTDRKRLIQLMVGREIDDAPHARSVNLSETILKVERLTGNGVKNLSFELHRGEILGFAGLVGCGRTEIMQVLYGAAPKESGRIFIKGKEVHITSPIEALKNGIGMIPEDRKKHGGFLSLPLKWNIVFSRLKDISHFGVVDKALENDLAGKYQKSLDIRSYSLDQLLQNLSGGNQQKVVMAKTLVMDTDIIIFDEPTRGIDVGAKQEIYKLMNKLAESGRAIIMISSEMDEILSMSDRIIVLCEGEMMGELNKDEMNKTLILDLASGNK
jgi:ribose transport system ATP-binding protein